MRGEEHLNYVEDLNFYHFNTSQPGVFQRHCESAFQLWDSQWSQTFKKSNLNIEVYSDDFLNREVGGLFLGTKAVGFMLYNFVDFATFSSQKTRYFQNYPRHVWSNHHEQKDLAFAPTYMTLHHDWRKSKTNLPISELLFGFAVLRFLESPADRLIGYARNDLRMNEVLYRHGGRALAKDVPAYNTPVDFIEISRQEAHLSEWNECAEMNLMFWNKTKSKTNKNMQTVFHKRGDKNHVITLYQQETREDHSGDPRRALGEQSFLSGLARANLPLHTLQPTGASDGSGLVGN